MGRGECPTALTWNTRHRMHTECMKVQGITVPGCTPNLDLNLRISFECIQVRWAPQTTCLYTFHTSVFQSELWRNAYRVPVGSGYHRTWMNSTLDLNSRTALEFFQIWWAPQIACTLYAFRALCLKSDLWWIHPCHPTVYFISPLCWFQMSPLCFFGCWDQDRRFSTLDLNSRIALGDWHLAPSIQQCKVDSSEVHRESAKWH